MRYNIKRNFIKTNFYKKIFHFNMDSEEELAATVIALANKKKRKIRKNLG